MGGRMSSAVIAARKGSLLRLEGNLPGGEQVLDHMPLRLATPYLAFERASVSASRATSGGGGSGTLSWLYTVRLAYQAVTNPHALESEKSLNDFVDDIETQMAADLDLTAYGRRLIDQVLVDVEPFITLEDGAEIKRARLVWELRIQ